LKYLKKLGKQDEKELLPPMQSHRPLLKIRRLNPGLALLLALLSCSTGNSLQDPRIEVEAIRITNVYQDSLDLEGTLRISNPNDLAARVAGYRYRLEVEGRRLVGGESSQGFSIAPRAIFRLTIPGTISFEDLLAAANKALAQDEIRYVLSGTLLMDTLIGKYPVPFSQEGQLNLSDILREKTRQFLKGL
jgi:LEA14-like dessication related protein